MTLQEFYAQIGGSYADTVRRLCSESFVLRFVKKYPANPSFDELCKAVGRSDWESAFRAAHTLKGVAQNLGFDRLYAVSVPLTEAMRGAKPLDDFPSSPPFRPCRLKPSLPSRSWTMPRDDKPRILSLILILVKMA